MSTFIALFVCSLILNMVGIFGYGWFTVKSVDPKNELLQDITKIYQDLENLLEKHYNEKK